MRKDVFRKGMILGVIILFVGASVSQVVGKNIDVFNSTIENPNNLANNITPILKKNEKIRLRFFECGRLVEEKEIYLNKAETEELSNKLSFSNIPFSSLADIVDYKIDILKDMNIISSDFKLPYLDEKKNPLSDDDTLELVYSGHYGYMIPSGNHVITKRLPFPLIRYLGSDPFIFGLGANVRFLNLSDDISDSTMIFSIFVVIEDFTGFLFDANFLGFYGPFVLIFGVARNYWGIPEIEIPG